MARAHESLHYQMDQYCDRAQAASQQLVHLSNQISALRVRYDRAVTAAQKPLRYNYRLRLTVLENLRMKMYQYMCQQATKMKEIEEQLSDTAQSDAEQQQQ